MKTALPIAQAEGIVLPNANQAPLKREQATADEFDTALEKEILERESKLKAPAREKPEQRPEQNHHTCNSEVSKQADGSFLRPDGRLQHCLSEIHTLPFNAVPDDAPETAPAKNDVTDPSAELSLEVPPETTIVASVVAQLLSVAPGSTDATFVQGNFDPENLLFLGDHMEAPRLSVSSIQADEEAHVAATTAPPLTSQTSSHLGHSERQEAFKSHLPSPLRRETSYQGKTTAFDLDAVANEIVSSTPVTVRDQQTHLSRDPVGRKVSPPQPTAPEDRDPTLQRRGQTQVSTNADEPRQVDLVQKNGSAGQISMKPADAPTPTAQLLSKILEVCDDESALSRAPAPSSTWLSTDRPFGAMIRLIRLELSPGSLGVVHVTLKGAHAALSISIEAEQPQTAASLGADQSTLSLRLKEAGYAVDELIVTTFDRSLDTAGPSRPEQTSGASSSALAGETDDLQRRNADDGERRQRHDLDETRQSEPHASERDSSRDGAEPQRAPSTAWRGRHMTRSV